MKQLFAVYSRRDLPAVRALRGEWSRKGYALWVDIDECKATPAFQTQIAEALARSDAILLIHSWEWIYDVQFVAVDLRFVLDVAQSAAECPTPIGLRNDEAPIPHQLRSLAWIAPLPNGETPDIDSAISRVSDDPAYCATALRAMADLQMGHDADASRLRVHMRQHWMLSVELFNRRAFADLIQLWQPFFDAPTFQTDHPGWADEPTVRCAIHGVKTILFQTCVDLGNRAPAEYVPRAYSILRELVTTPPFVAVLDDELTELTASRAEIQNLNYADTLEVALQWSQGWDSRILSRFGIPEDESAAVFNRTAARLYELRRATAWAKG